MRSQVRGHRLNHNHIYDQTHVMLDAGAQLVSVHAEEDDLAADYIKAFPQARRVNDKRAVLEDRTIQLVVSATIPNALAVTAIQIMRHSKDVMVDKPDVDTLEELVVVSGAGRNPTDLLSLLFGPVRESSNRKGLL